MAIEFSCTSEAPAGAPMVEILLVQHDQQQVKLTLRVLDTHHFADRIHVARDGREALEFLFCTGAYADRTPGNPRLVLLDLDIAYADNLDVIRRIKGDARTSDIPVTIIAASTEDRLAAMEALRTGDMQVPVVVMAGATLQEAAQAFELAGDSAGEVGLDVDRDGTCGVPHRADGTRAVAGASPGAPRPDPELESLARLARGMAHEFNNLFSVIVAYTEVLLRDLDLDGERVVDRLVGRHRHRERPLDTRRIMDRDTHPPGVFCGRFERGVSFCELPCDRHQKFTCTSHVYHPSTLDS